MSIYLGNRQYLLTLGKNNDLEFIEHGVFMVFCLISRQMNYGNAALLYRITRGNYKIIFFCPEC